MRDRFAAVLRESHQSLLGPQDCLLAGTVPGAQDSGDGEVRALGTLIAGYLAGDKLPEHLSLNQYRDHFVLTNQHNGRSTSLDYEQVEGLADGVTVLPSRYADRAPADRPLFDQPRRVDLDGLALTLDPASPPGASGLRQELGLPAHALGQDFHVADAAAPGQVSTIDRAVGKNLALALDGQTLAGNAANAKHLAKMDQSASIVATVERLPSRIDSVTGFQVKDAFRLYRHCFPNPDEREPISEIRKRIKHYKNPLTDDGAMFHSHVFADRDGAVVGYSQGSTVPSEAGLFYYWQYGCVADREYMKRHYGKDVNPREQGVLNTIHGVNAATLAANAAHARRPALGLMWESEPRGLGDDAASIRFTDTRLSIHTRAGGRVMMGVTQDGELVNLHLQPRLTPESEPIALHIMYRPLKYEEGDEAQRGEMKKSDAEAMMMGWIDNFRREGFAKKDVQEAEDEIRRRLARCTEVVLLPADQVPDVVTLAGTDPILKKQVLKLYQVGTLDEARAFYDSAMQPSLAGGGR